MNFRAIDFHLLLLSTERTVWPVLSKFCHFGIILRILNIFLSNYLLFGKIVNILSKYFILLAEFHCSKLPNIQMAR